VAILAIVAAVTVTMLLAIAGHSPLTGPRLLPISSTHGVNEGDLVPLTAWVVACVSCWFLWRRTK